MSVLLLSKDVLRLVFQHLTVPELGQCATVCHHWNQVLSEDDGTDADISVWRAKWEARWWMPLRTMEAQSSARLRFSRQVQWERNLAEHLERGRFQGNCHEQRWLLCGHSTRVNWLLPVGGSILLTLASRTGEVRSWKLPITSRRPPGALVPIAAAEDETATTMSNNAKDLLCGENVQLMRQLDEEHVVFGSMGGNLILVRFQVAEVGSGNAEVPLGDDVKARLVKRFAGHSRPINSACGNSKTLVTACADGLLRVFSINSDKAAASAALAEEEPLLVLRGHASGVNSVKFGSQDCTVLSSSTDQTVCVWNYETGECLQRFGFECVAGGPAIVGCSRHALVVLWETYGEAFVSVRQLNDKRQDKAHSQTTMKTQTASRFETAAVYEQYILCGTKEGRLLEFNLLTGSKTCETDPEDEAVCGASSVVTVSYLGLNTCFAINYDGQLSLWKRHAAKPQMVDQWRLTQRIDLGMRPETYMYDEPTHTLFLASQGYLVRALVFE